MQEKTMHDATVEALEEEGLDAKVQSLKEELDRWMAKAHGTAKAESMNWREQFDERELKEIDFSVTYAKQYAHGTSAHLLRMIVSKMVSILNNAESVINGEPEKSE